MRLAGIFTGLALGFCAATSLAHAQTPHDQWLAKIKETFQPANSSHCWPPVAGASVFLGTALSRGNLVGLFSAVGEEKPLFEIKGIPIHSLNDEGRMMTLIVRVHTWIRNPSSPASAARGKQIICNNEAALEAIAQRGVASRSPEFEP